MRPPFVAAVFGPHCPSPILESEPESRVDSGFHNNHDFGRQIGAKNKSLADVDPCFAMLIVQNGQ